MTRMAISVAESSRRMDPEPPEPMGRETTFDLAQVASALRRQRRVFLAWALAGLVGGFAYLATTPRSYEADAALLITGEANPNIDEVSLVDDARVSEITIENALQVLRSQRLALQVVNRLDLQDDERFMSEQPSGLSVLVDSAKGLVRDVLSGLTGGGTDAPAGLVPNPEAQERHVEEQVAERLRNRAGIYRIGQSSAIGVRFETQSPELAAELANAYVQGYADDAIQANQAVNEQVADWLGQRIAELGAQAEEALQAVERYRVENGLIGSREELITQDSVRRVNEEYATALADQARSRALVATYEAILALGPEALEDQSRRVLIPDAAEPVSALQQEFGQLLARRDEIAGRFGADHPEALRLEAPIDDLANQLYNEIGQTAAVARGNLDVATERVAALRDTLDDLVETNAVADQALVELRALEQRADAVSNLYEALLVQAERANQQRTLPVSNMRVLSLATVPQSHASPSTTRTLGLGIVLALMAALVHAALRERRERFVRTGADVTEGLGQRFLGYLPVVDRPWSEPPRAEAPPKGWENGPGLPPQPAALANVALPVLGQPRSQFAESLRGIRLTSDLAWPGEGGRIIGVTSLMPGEGKTTVAANLAAVLAAGGHPTLLIDTDLRRADLSLRLGLTGRRGLVSIARHNVPAASATARLGATGVDAIGCEEPNLGALAYDTLSAPNLQRMLFEARSRYRFVVLDMAPFGPVIDARLCMGLVDQLVIVASWGQTPRPLLSYALTHEPLIRGKLLGVALNRVDLDALPQYGAPDMQPGYAAYHQAGAQAAR